MDPKQWSVGILVFDEVEVLDFAGPFEVLSLATYPDGHSNPFAVKIIAEQKRIVSARNGLQVYPDYSFDDVPHFDILVIPGGPGARERQIHNQTLIAWLTDRMNDVQIMTSVCTGALLLAKAGLLTGKRATTHWASYDRLATEFPDVKVERDVKYVDEGSIVTSGGISAGINMAFHLVQRLAGVDIARETAKRMEYDISLT